jgi:very-short-patch-repair endonuclease
MGPERQVLAVAARQHGVIAYEQLLAAGLSPDAVRHRGRSGWLRRIHRGVYLVGPIEPPLARAMAATLACGRGAQLSHHPAAILRGLLPGPARGMHVTVPGRHVAGPAGVTVHRTDGLDPRDATRHLGIPVTSPARTLLDLATEATPRELARAIEQAQILNLVTARSLHAQFARYPHHKGLAAVREATTAEPRLTRSEAERRLLELIRTARLPEPETNVRVAGHEVDFLWREHALVVEVDGYAFHATRAAFERDRRRDAALKAHGIDTIRVSWTQIAGEPAALVALLARATASAAAARRAARRSGGTARAG